MRRTLLVVLAVVTLGHEASAQSNPYAVVRRSIPYQSLSNPTVIFRAPANVNTQTLSLPFMTKFYDSFYDTVTLGVNGALVFGLTSQIADVNPTPGARLPNAFIAPFWDDLHIPVGQPGTVGYEVGGTAPQRWITFEWKDLHRFPSTRPGIRFKITLYEGPAGQIDVHYGAFSAGGTQPLDGTMAMEDENGQRVIYFDANGLPCTDNCSRNRLQTFVGTRVRMLQDPGVDIFAARVTPPRIAFVGGPIAVEALAGNLHGMAIGPFRLALRLSSDPSLSSTTDLLTSMPLYLGQFQTRAFDLQGTVPEMLDPGLYYVGLEVDSTSAIAEVEESNNQVVSTFAMRVVAGGPDLEVTRVEPDRAMTTAGGRVNVLVEARNRGATLATNARISVVLSTNRAISAQDLVLDEVGTDLAPGAALPPASLLVTAASVG